MAVEVLRKKCEEALRLQLAAITRNRAEYEKLLDFWAQNTDRIEKQTRCPHPRFASDRNFHACCDCGASFQR